MKVLIVSPKFSLLGGVSNHYRGLSKYFDNRVSYHFIEETKSSVLKKFISYGIFIWSLLQIRPRTVLLNPSFQHRSLLRDFGFLLISRVFRIKVIVFFHGWDKSLEQIVRRNAVFKYLMKLPDAYIVLSNDYRDFLDNLNLSKPIYLETTKVDDDYLHNLDLKKKKYNRSLLVMSRIVESKGVLKALDIFEQMLGKHPDFVLDIVGDGELLPKVKSLTLKKGLRDKVNFHGYITGDDLRNVIKENSVLLLPTTHGEGLPTSIVESMGIGLVVVTSSVGGIKDLYSKVNFGISLESNRVDEYVTYLSWLFESRESMIEIGERNSEYVKSHLVASVVAKRLEKIIFSS